MHTFPPQVCDVPMSPSKVEGKEPSKAADTSSQVSTSTPVHPGANSLPTAPHSPSKSVHMIQLLKLKYTYWSKGYINYMVIWTIFTHYNAKCFLSAVYFYRICFLISLHGLKFCYPLYLRNVSVLFEGPSLGVQRPLVQLGARRRIQRLHHRLNPTTLNRK